MNSLQSLCCTTAKAQVAVTSKVRVCASARQAWREHVSPAWSVRLQTPQTRTGSASAHPSHAPHRSGGDGGWSLVHKSNYVAARRLYKGRLRNDIQMVTLEIEPHAESKINRTRQFICVSPSTPTPHIPHIPPVASRGRGGRPTPVASRGRGGRDAERWTVGRRE